MGKLSVSKRLIMPMLAFAFAFAFAFVPAAYADDVQSGSTGSSLSSPSELNGATINLSGTSFVFTGRPITPSFTVTLNGNTLVEGTDYWKFYDENDKVGTATVCAFNDTDDTDPVPAVFAEFKITPASIKNASIKVTNEVYTGKKLKPAPVVVYNGITLKKGTDYTVKYGKNKKIGKGTVVITGKGNFTGTVTKKFKITKASLKNVKFSNVKDKVYTGSKITPNITLKFKGKKLKKGRDYTVTYKSNTNVGVAKIKVKGKGNFKGKHTVQFAITARSIIQANPKLTSTPYWTGDAVEPSVKVTYKGRTLSLGKDYTMHYVHAQGCRYAYAQDKVYLYGKGNFKDTLGVVYTIQPRPMTNSAIKVSGIPTSMSLPTGGACTPQPTVTFNNGYYNILLQNGKDYTVSYANNTAKGTAKVLITGKGNYTGTKTVTFKIA